MRLQLSDIITESHCRLEKKKKETYRDEVSENKTKTTIIMSLTNRKHQPLCPLREYAYNFVCFHRYIASKHRLTRMAFIQNFGRFCLSSFLPLRGKKKKQNYK